jgi:hypothetical protein
MLSALAFVGAIDFYAVKYTGILRARVVTP